MDFVVGAGAGYGLILSLRGWGFGASRFGIGGGFECCAAFEVAIRRDVQFSFLLGGWSCEEGGHDGSIKEKHRASVEEIWS